MSPVRTVWLDPSPLRGIAFRHLFLARSITRLGSVLTSTTILLHVARQTGSPLSTGLVLGVQLIPILLFGLVGGHLADVADRRRVAVRAELALFSVSLTLVLCGLASRPPVVGFYVIVAAGAALAAVQRAALDAAVPRLVDRAQLSVASAWLSAATTTATLVGPALGAALFYSVGPEFCYAFDSVTFFVASVLLTRLPPMAPVHRTHRTPIIASLRDGMSYLNRRSDIRASYLLDLAAITLADPTTLLPFLAAGVGGGATSALLFSAAAAGALVMSALSGWTSRVRRLGVPLVCACAAFGVTTTMLGLTQSLLAMLIVLALGGAADCLSVIFRDTLWNATVPDHLRGRIAGIEVVSYAIGAPASGLVLGVTSSVVGSAGALAVGGSGALVCITIIAIGTPRLRSVTVRPEPPDRSD